MAQTIETVPLFNRVLGDPNSPPLIILHGLLGASDNWNSLAKQYTESHCVWLIDQRNHGRSKHHASNTYSDLAADLRRFMDENNLDKSAVLGHSMGGKTALQFAHESPERVTQLIIADMSPRSYSVHHQDVFHALETAPIETASERAEIAQHLTEHLASATMVSFLMKNLRREKKGGFHWRPNIKALSAALKDIADEVPFGVNTIPTLVIYAGQSGYVLEPDLDRYGRNGLQLETHCMTDVGHWLHAEDPASFYTITSEFLVQSSI